MANQRGGGEWMGADKNSIQEFGLWTLFHWCTSAIFSFQVHAATEVLLNLGARSNQQPQDTRSGNTHDTAAGSPNRSGWFLKPVRSLLLDLASHRQGNQSDRFAVRPVLSRNSPKTIPREKPASRTSPPLNKNSHSTTGTSLPKNSSRQPTGLTGQTGLGNQSDQLWSGQSGRTQPAGKTQTFHQSISRWVPWIKVILWG
jgi:hypothetical protein